MQTAAVVFRPLRFLLLDISIHGSPFVTCVSTCKNTFLLTTSILMTLRSRRNCKGDFTSYLNGRNLYVQKKMVETWIRS